MREWTKKRTANYPYTPYDGAQFQRRHQPAQQSYAVSRDYFQDIHCCLHH